MAAPHGNSRPRGVRFAVGGQPSPPPPLVLPSHLAYERSLDRSWPTRSTSACSKLRRLPSEEGTGATTLPRLDSASARTHKLWQQQESHTILYYYARRAQSFVPSFKQVSNIPGQLLATQHISGLSVFRSGPGTVLAYKLLCLAWYTPQQQQQRRTRTTEWKSGKGSCEFKEKENDKDGGKANACFADSSEQEEEAVQRAQAQIAIGAPDWGHCWYWSWVEVEALF